MTSDINPPTNSKSLKFRIIPFSSVISFILFISIESLAANIVFFIFISVLFQNKKFLYCLDLFFPLIG